MNDSEDTPSLNSAPTMFGGGARRPAEPYDEHSLGSAPTMTPGGTNGGASSPSEPPIGRIDQYELIRKLGGGGFGVVYLARDTVSGVEVALKTLHPLLKTNAEEMERLREKFALISRLSHPNIATALVLHPVREVAIADDEARRELRLFPGDSVMVMRYAPGVTLSKWRRQFPDGKVPLDQVLEVGRQIASALDYAHGEKIVHRDIKPSNVMVETLAASSAGADDAVMQNAECRMQNGGAGGGTPLATDHWPLATSKIRVRILDFGLAAEIRSSMSRVSTEAGDTSGTRPYMAPEQWLGRKQDGRTDQYALACVLYELLAGEPPFAGVFETGDPAIMRTAVERDAPEEIEDVPPVVNAALLKALAKNPKERFGSCSEFVENCLAQSSRSSQRESHAEAQNGGTPWERGHPARGADSESGTALESDVLRRKLTFTRDLKAIPETVRADKDFSKFVSTAEDEMTVTEEACKFGRFVTAAESLNRVEAALDDLRKARVAREEAERKAKEEAVRLAREKAEAERKVRENAEVERKAREEAERKAREERERLARGEAERKAHEQRERKVREHGGVQLWAGGPYWAGTNVGAEKPEDYGLYFWWGDTVGYRREGDAWVASDGSSRNFKFSGKNTPTFGRDNATLQREGWTTSSGVLAPEQDAANVHWGGGWRMPTKQELDDLGSKCDWTWTTVNGVNGYVVKGCGAYSQSSIFLPAAGYGGGTSLDDAGLYGDYWASVPSPHDSFDSWSILFASGYHDTYYSYRNSGQSVRPVLGSAE